MSVKLRDHIYLIGCYSNNLSGNKLPSNREVMKVLFFHIRIKKLNLRESSKITVKDVITFWEKARIPIQELKHCIAKLEELYTKWRSLQKHCKRKSENQKKKEAEFLKTLDALFDIAHDNALEMINIEEDKKFLISQRKEGRPGFMCGIDHELARRERRIEQRKEIEFQRKERSMLEAKKMGSVPLSFSSESERSFAADQENNYEHFPAVTSPAPQKKSRGKVVVITEKLAAALDACKISDRNAVHIIAATAESLGHDITNIILNKESVRVARQKLRSKRVSELKNKLNAKDLDAVCLHWDGKLLPALEGKEKVDRLPILISNGNVEELLEVPALKSGTGRAQAQAICKSLFEWGLQDYVKALVFDTTPVNTGRFNGTCSIIENTLERDLLYFACRHHIFELILKSVFDVEFCKADGPNVQIFQRFQKCWPSINIDNFRIGIENEKVKNAISLCDVKRITNFLNNVLQEKQPRDDYREFIELALIFLGKTPTRSCKIFRAPGAMHHARWMSKAIYTLKIFLFRDEFDLTEVELNALCDVSIFIVKVYVEAWFCAPSPIKAPYHDFMLLTVFSQYRSVESEIATVALEKFCSHLWYLGTENVALAFFDENVPVETKKKNGKSFE